MGYPLKKLLIFLFPVVVMAGTGPEPQTTALVEALRRAAPDTTDPGLYSDWRMRPTTIAAWTKRCTGVAMPAEELAANPILARETVTCVMGSTLARELVTSGGNEELAIQRAAAWWMLGDPEQYQAPTIATWMGRLMSNYRQLRNLY